MDITILNNRVNQRVKMQEVVSATASASEAIKLANHHAGWAMSYLGYKAKDTQLLQDMRAMESQWLSIQRRLIQERDYQNYLYLEFIAQNIPDGSQE